MTYRLLKPFLHYKVGHVFETNKYGQIWYSPKSMEDIASDFLHYHDLVTWLQIGMLEEVNEESMEEKIILGDFRVKRCECGTADGQHEHPRSFESFKNSVDDLDRLVFYISGLSPHNLWKGRLAIDEYLISHNK